MKHKMHVGLVFVCFCLQEGLLQEYVPKFLQNKYNMNANMGYGVAKSPPVKTVGKTKHAGFLPPGSFKGGCVAQPKAPYHAKMTCSKFGGCKITCEPQYKFPDGSINVMVQCQNKIWIPLTESGSIPHCEPICLPECENKGICVSPNLCNCPDNYSGPQCQFENKPCVNYPTMPINAKRSCRANVCTISCLAGYQFPDGSRATMMECKSGNWQPTKSAWKAVPDCEAICDPPCWNGGNCLSYNVCQCPQEYRGPRCQFKATDCNPKKMDFNGAYNCSGNSNSLRCSVSCPQGISFESAPQPYYTCLYETGLFEPYPIPQCVYPDDMAVVPLITNSHTIHMQNHLVYASSKSVPDNEIPHGPDTDTYFVPLEPQSQLENEFILVEDEVPKPGVCLTWGGSHFKTFDGTFYSFNSQCEFTMARDAIDNTFTVITSTTPYQSNEQEKSYRTVKVFLQDKEFILKKSEQGVPILAASSKVHPIPGQMPGLRTEMIAHFVVLSLDSVGAKIKWDGNQFVQIEINEALWNRTEGLCGRMDGRQANDLLTKKGSKANNVISFVNEWKVNTLNDDECNDNPTEPPLCQDQLSAHEFCSKLLLDNKLMACQKTVNVKLLLETCKADFCNCGKAHPNECACEALNVYVRTCAHRGVKNLVSWRDEKVCPMTCTGGRIYMPCAPVGGQATCGASVETNTDSICEEGCYCPTGTFLHENACITKDACPCRLRGKNFPSGASVPKDCNTCTCNQGQWLCTQVACGSRCAALGDPHYITFDGKHYDFMGQCSYYLVKTDNFSIEAENVVCSGAISAEMNFLPNVLEGLPSCTKSVTIRVGGMTITLKQNHDVMVNGKDITKLPFVSNGIKIRSISSIFLFVSLPNKAEIWWDGLTRVYVDVPASFKGQTQGLCGTFNDNQKDDFLTPENDVETAVASFANKWKTEEKCNDVSLELSNHPCNVNVQNKALAEKHCKVLKSRLFAPCHWYVDPEQFYKDCLYDVCACNGKISKCFCPMVAAYAQECAAKGSKIPWRMDVPECGMVCPRGQTYQICGNPCSRTCSDIALQNDCRSQCVEGCNCPEGQALDEFGECIPVGQCKCHRNGLDFPAGFKEVRQANGRKELCTCSNANWHCQTAKQEDSVHFPPVTVLQSKCNATRNFVFTTCESPEPVTCKNMHEQNLYSPDVCHSGCECKKGYVLNSKSRTCVQPSECPCHHGGRSYKEKSVVQSDCNTCNCKNAKWECSQRECTAECSAWGDSHFKTFDGRLFDYQGQCDYVLAKGSISVEDSFDVVIQNVPCGTLGVSCSKSVSVKIGSGAQQESVTLTKGKRVREGIFKRFTVRSLDMFVIIEAADLGLIVHWDKGTRVYVKLDPRWKTKVKGLCGDYNDNELDDFQTPSGGLSEVSPILFGDSWKLQSYCPETHEIEDTCEKRPERKMWALTKCDILKSPTFAPCHQNVPVEHYLERCIFDSCACDQGGDCACLCTAIAAYAQECNNKGSPIKWRSQELCPIECDERCSQYSPCISTCAVETCENLIVQSPLSKLCKEDSCVEGCHPKPCPAGEVFVNSSMLSCVSRTLCKPICMEVDGVLFYEGDLMEEDSCHTCFCSRGIKSCKGQTCPPTKTSMEPPSHEQNTQCKSGWTEWMNQDKIIPGKNETKYLQKESLPDEIVLNNLIGSAKCSKEDMINIECRTIKTHLSAKDTGLDAECSLERGLICKSEKGKRPCPDFEIRVLCKCDAPPNPCDPRKPSEEFTGDCHKFYQCAPTKNGHGLVEKTCGKDMMYNPTTMICDWPKNVVEIKPECSAKQKDVSEVDLESSGCESNERFDECAIECDKLCLHYKYVVMQQGQCQGNTKCEPGCVPADRNITCGENKLWLNDKSCVVLNDCMCASHDGRPVKPGTVLKESECMICQCIDNYYTCDKTACGDDEQENRFYPEFNENITRSVELPSTLIVMNTVTPPKECPTEMYIDLIQGDVPLPDESFEASSVYSSNFASHYARIDSKSSPESGGCWMPKDNNNHQYLQINLGKMEPIYGVVIKGSPIFTEYVTSFKIMYTTLPSGLWNYVLDHSKDPQVFRGGLDSNTPVQHIFIYPIEAQYVKILPLTWQGNIALRVELIGCGMHKTTLPYGEFVTIAPPRADMCLEPMGLLDGTMSDQQITVSSQYGGSTSKKDLKLNSLSAWRPVTNSPTEFVIFNLVEPRNITGFVSKGGPTGWVTAFRILYSQNGKVWNPMLDDLLQEKNFLGNFDENTAQMTNFIMPILATYVKIIPIKWHQNIELRLELNGCFIPYPDMEPQLPEPDSLCNECPGVQMPQMDIDACPCLETLWWDGKKCVTRSECPCIVGEFVYPIGTVFEKSDCSQCICKLGGIEHCELKSCPKCDVGLKSTRTSTCACICLPCEEGTVLCPTSDICIHSTSWCDGVQDCPDDEINCHTTVQPTTEFEMLVGSSTSQPQRLIDKCPVLECPEGFKLESKPIEEMKLQHIPTLLSNYNQPTAVKKTSYLNSVKANGHKSQLARPTNTASLQNDKRDIVECPELKCVRSEVLPASPHRCPPVACPPGFTVELSANEVSKKRCPHFDCIVQPPPDAVCNVTGNFFNTFDGVEFKYDICNHVLARDLEETRWEVLLRKNCSTKQFCRRNVIINHDENTFVLHQDLTVEFNGFKYSVAQTKKIGSNSNVFLLTRLGNTLMFASNRFGFWVLWDNKNNVKLGVSAKLSQKVDGLCGFYNGNPLDDKRQPDGSESRTTAEFGDSWLEPNDKPHCESDSCPPHLQNKAWDMCNQVKSTVLSPCGKLLDLDAFISRCVESTCSCLEMNTHNRSSHRYDDLCRCKAMEFFVVDCMVQDKDLELTDWRTILDCPETCKTPLVYQDCYRRRCEPSCETMTDPKACAKLPNMCFPGCYCPPGLVRKDDRCIPSSICKDCECNVLPHLQYITYDNSNFSISGNCVYVMSRDVLEKYHDEHQFQVLITNHPCRDNAEKMCVGKITILYQGHKIHVFFDAMRNKLKLIVDAERVEDFEEIEDWATVSVTNSKHMRILLIKVQIHVSVYFPSLGVSVKAPSHKYAGKMEGLCGDCNKDPLNDMRSSTGEPILSQDELATNWFYDQLPGMTKENCQNAQTLCDAPDVENDPCTQLLDSSRYAQCHPLLDPGMFVEWCRKDICGGHPERACAAISSYARECLGNGFCVNWHSDLCPQMECPEGQEYRTCGTSCPITCESLKDPKAVCVDVPTSGCFCPDGKVMQNTTCVEARMCITCDTQGHYSGDKWSKDPCTTCECEGASIRCETKHCPAVDTICENGFTPVKLSKEATECCEKYICIPAATASPTCDPPQTLECAQGQVAKLDSKPDGCQQFVCECIPPEECEPINIEPDADQEPGMEKKIKEGGCCKSIELVCNQTQCPVAPKCEEFYSMNVTKKEGKCCESFSCLPPESCIVELKYIDADDGGERARSQYERQKVLKSANETWSDGPCRHCECFGSKSSGFQSVCTNTECPLITSSSDYPEYDLLAEPVKGQCCASIKRAACKFDNKIYRVGEKWTDPLDVCTKLECTETKGYGIQKLTQVISCDEACDLGFEYVPATKRSGECCGTCKAISCVVDGKLKTSGTNWTTDDFCTHFTCVNQNGSFQVQSTNIVCAEIPADQIEQFVYEFEVIEGECCKRHKMTACKVGETMYMVGQSWPCPEGDKCKTYTCVEEAPGKLKVKESVKTCDKDCAQGWAYQESNSSCCGECVQYACVDNAELKMANSKWTSEDGCTTYSCDQHSDQFLITSHQVACPLIDDCPLENVYDEGCCSYCNVTALAMTDCIPQAMDGLKSVHLISDQKNGHGICRNVEAIPGFNECVGTCHSATFFNKKTGTHENVCSCCRAVKYQSLEVELTCQDGYKFTKTVSVPSTCSCEECSSKSKNSLSEVTYLQK